jgi:hypothetical protein
MHLRIISLATAAGLLVATSAVSLAQNPNSGAGDPATQNKNSMPGQSGATPGHQMQEKGSVPGQPGASGYAPGRQQDTTGQSDRAGAANPDGKMGNQRAPKEK